MSLAVFVRRDMLSHVSQVRRGTLACGVAGVAGNKVDLCVSLRLLQTISIFYAFGLLLIPALRAAFASRFAYTRRLFCLSPATWPPFKTTWKIATGALWPLNHNQSLVSFMIAETTGASAQG
jgi:hypothetical protein